MGISKVYIQKDSQNRITKCEGGYTTPADLSDWILIDEGTGDKYNLCQTHYFEGGLYTRDGIPLYKWDGKQVVKRTDEEIEADRIFVQSQKLPTPQEQMRADIDFLAALQGVIL